MNRRKVLSRALLASLPPVINVYHRTRFFDNVAKIKSYGFQAGQGGLYGDGIYCTTDLESLMRPNMERNYGPYIIQSELNTEGIIDFNSLDSIRDSKYGWVLSVLSENQSFSPWNGPSSVKALNLVKHSKFGYNFFQSADVRGLVFTGNQDGNVVVLYPWAAKQITPKYYTRSVKKDSYRKDLYSTLHHIGLDYRDDVFPWRSDLEFVYTFTGDRFSLRHMGNNLYWLDLLFVDKDGESVTQYGEPTPQQVHTVEKIAGSLQTHPHIEAVEIRSNSFPQPDLPTGVMFSIKEQGFASGKLLPISLVAHSKTCVYRQSEREHSRD